MPFILRPSTFDCQNYVWKVVQFLSFELYTFFLFSDRLFWQIVQFVDYNHLLSVVWTIDRPIWLKTFHIRLDPIFQRPLWVNVCHFLCRPLFNGHFQKYQKSFFMVYQMACKTIFICFLEDERRNDGSKSRPYAMSVELFQLLTTIQKKRRPKKKAIMSNDEKADLTMEKLPQSTRQTTNLEDLVMTIVRTKRKVRYHKNRKYVSAIRSKTFESKF